VSGATGSTSARTVRHGWAAAWNTVHRGLRTRPPEWQAQACNADGPGARFTVGDLLNCFA
jgi:hypothetical protein